MDKLSSQYNATVAIGTPVTLEVLPAAPAKVVRDDEQSYRVTALGAGTLQIETKAAGMSDFNVETSISAESIILDFNSLAEIRLTASVANVETSIKPYTRGRR